MFASFELNRAYADTDVLVSLAKLKQHETTGVTLTMKNMFGITPNSMYGGKAGDEDATGGRGPIHDPRRYVDLELPGLKPAFQSTEAGVRVPYTIADLCAARPVDLAIIDGITAMTRGENPFSSGPKTRIANPGIMIVGRSPVSVDAVGASIMGFDPRAARGTGAFARGRCENHLLLAEQAGLGTADLARIDVRACPSPMRGTPTSHEKLLRLGCQRAQWRAPAIVGRASRLSSDGRRRSDAGPTRRR